jgi:hypothetical protein
MNPSFRASQPEKAYSAKFFGVSASILQSIASATGIKVLPYVGESHDIREFT